MSKKNGKPIRVAAIGLGAGRRRREGLAVQAMLDGLYRSAASGREVRINVPQI